MKFARVVAATALVVAATPVLGSVTAAPAQAAGCSGAGGVTVVVDRGSLGGGVSESCVGAGGKARTLFESAGHSQRDDPRQPGFVCHVDDLPGKDCAKNTSEGRYWGLWWSDGTTSGWKYATLGVDSLRVPEGGYVAWAWQDGSTSARDAVPPRTSAPARVGTDRDAGGSGGSGGSGSADTSPGGGAARGTAPSTTPGGSSAPGSGVPRSAATDPTGAPTDAATEAPTTGATTDPAADSTDAPTSAAPSAGETMAYDEDAAPSSAGSDAADEAAGGSVPWWALGIVAVVLAAGGGGVALARRRRSEAGPLL